MRMRSLYFTNDKLRIRLVISLVLFILVLPLVVILAQQKQIITQKAQGNSLQTISHVFVIAMENHNWADIKGAAPYITNTLLPLGAHAEQYYNPPGLHPSEPNYIWLEAGTNFNITNDSDPTINHINSTNHLVTQLQSAGIPWKAYVENINGSDCPLTSFGTYAAKHLGMVFFDDVTQNNNRQSSYCIQHIRPYTELTRDLQNNTVSSYNFITPNVCNDMHSCSIATGDTWLSQEIPKILNSQAYKNNGIIFITWDEGLNGDGPIGMIVLSPLAKPGYSNTIHYTHSSTLKTIQEIFGLSPFLGDAGNATDLTDLLQLNNTSPSISPTISPTATISSPPPSIDPCTQLSSTPSPSPTSPPTSTNACANLVLNTTCGLDSNGDGLFCGGNCGVTVGNDSGILYHCHNNTQVGSGVICSPQCLICSGKNNSDKCGGSQNACGGGYITNQSDMSKYPTPTMGTNAQLKTKKHPTPICDLPVHPTDINGMQMQSFDPSKLSSQCISSGTNPPSPTPPCGNVSPSTITPITSPSSSPAPSGDPTSTCGGKYDLNYPIPHTNFGDPVCDFTKNGLFTLLQQLDPANASFWFNTVVTCESGYNPNAIQNPAIAVDPAGAWGLFQMGRGRNGQFDHGDVPWREQARNAVTYNNNLFNLHLGWHYWACGRSRWQ